MGTAVSRQTDLASNEYIVRFISNEHITPNDPFWNRFLSYNLTPPVTEQGQKEFDLKIEVPCLQLFVNNSGSGNFGSLIEVFLVRASYFLSEGNAENEMMSWQTFNALFVIRCIIKFFLLECRTETQLLVQFEAGSERKKNEVLSNLESFLNALIELIVDVEIGDVTYAVHLEAVNCLLVLLSLHLFVQETADNSSIYRLVMQGRYAIHAPLLMKTLLQHFIDERKAPPSFTGSSGSSIVFGLAAELWSLLTFTKKNNSVDSAENATNFKYDCPLANHSLLLVLVLTNHCTTQVNPYRLSLFSCANAQDNTPIPPTKATTVFKIDYSSLYNSICKHITADATTLLLYLLVHRNQTFRTYLLARADVENLVIPILKTLYNASSSNSHHIYMSLIILLILSEDDTFNKAIHETKLKPVTWYTERSISEISLGGLLILVVIRTVQYNMLKMRDKYLHTNCLAALANMSGQFRGLHPYVSQRLVSLFEMLAKKYNRLGQQIKSNENDVQDANDEDSLVQDLAVLVEVLRMVLEILNSCLTNQLINNPNLVYTMLYKKQIFEPFCDNPAFQDIMQNLDFVLKYFSKLLESKAHELDVKEVLAVIQNGAKEWPRERLRKFPDLKFRYVEEDHPEDFFIPYVWLLVCQQSVLHWGPDNIKLFSSDNPDSVAVC